MIDYVFMKLYSPNVKYINYIFEIIKYKYLLTITYVIEINKEYYEIKKLKKLRRFTVTVIINDK